jgi:hypothetical protein
MSHTEPAEPSLAFRRPQHLTPSEGTIAAKPNSQSNATSEEGRERKLDTNKIDPNKVADRIYDIMRKEARIFRERGKSR